MGIVGLWELKGLGPLEERGELNWRVGKKGPGRAEDNTSGIPYGAVAICLRPGQGLLAGLN